MAIHNSSDLKKHTPFLNFILLLAITVISILSVESFCYFYLHIPAHMPPLVYFEPSQIPHKRLTPDAEVKACGAYREFCYKIATDDYGFRKTYPFLKNQDHYPIVILGDSQSFGVGMDDEKTFASLLAQNTGSPILNTACPGYNTIEELLTYENRVKPFKPEHVVLFFFAGNDPYENFKNMDIYEETESPAPVSDTPSSWLKDIKSNLAKHSAIYNSLIKLRQIPQINQFLYRHKLVNPIPPAELAIFRKGDNPEAAAHWRITEEVILDLKKEVESNGSKFSVVFIPDRYQVEPSHWKQWLARYNLNADDFDLTLPNQHLAAFAQNNHIRYEDTTESLKKLQAEGRNGYWNIDSHLNVSGNQAIADFVASHLLHTDSAKQ